MPNHTITFISSNGKGMTKNLNLLRQSFQDKSYNFEYYLKNIKKSKSVELLRAYDTLTKAKIVIPSFDVQQEYNPLSEKQMYSDRAKIAKQAENIVCCDCSLPKKENFFVGTNIGRTLILEPYNYFFSSVLEQALSQSVCPNQNFSNFSRIVSYTPFLNDIAQKACIAENVEYCCDAKIPFAESLCNANDKQTIRKRAEKIFPQIAGKKVVSVLTTGDKQKGTGTKFFDLDVLKLCRELPDDWIIVTNNTLISDMTARLDMSFANKFVSVSASSMLFADILYFSEIVLTDSPAYSCAFASTKKPFYFVNYDDSPFTEFVMKFYSSLFIAELNDIPSLIGNSKLSASHEDFIDKFAPRTQSGGRELTDIICPEA